MKKHRLFFGIGCLMAAAAIGFMAYALNYPEASFPWHNGVTYAIYAVYSAVTVSMFCISKKTKKK